MGLHRLCGCSIRRGKKKTRKKTIFLFLVCFVKVLRVALNDFKTSFAELCASPSAEALVLESLHSVGLQNGISAFEMPR